tara:strand:+ start:479 stop:1123 length:645 start_codon:yes stop_codon:yes gene_type:complete
VSWIAVIVLPAGSFLVAALLLRVRRGGWTVLGATLLFGLAGYALQGSPDQPASPGQAQAADDVDGELLVEARREFFDTSQFPSRWIVTGDSYVRRGDFEAASGFYRNAVEESPKDREAWLALGISLVEHAEGRLTPAALEAFERAQVLDEENGGPRYFLGLAWLRSGEIERTRDLWREAIELAPAEAPWRESLALRLLRLEGFVQTSNPETPEN